MAKKLKKFIIFFDDAKILYFPGQHVSGKVVVELEEETPITGVYVQVVGEGVVRVSDKRAEVYNDKEVYTNYSVKFSGGTDQIGIHSYPFALRLPLGLPSTFLGKHGWVQYFCRAILKVEDGPTHKNQQVFIVMNPIDLNNEASILSQPFHCAVEHNLGLTCFSQGPVSCEVKLDKGGYVPGETIVIWARVHNQSKVTVKRTKASLTETIQYLAFNKVVQAEIRELCAVVRDVTVKPRDFDEWKEVQLKIPPLPPTNLRGCRLIRIQYDVFFVIEPRSFENSIKLQLPIMVATYPYRNSDGTLKKKRFSSYPTFLPTARD